MRVLILCHDFPPLNTMGARRPFSWYNYFPKFGIHPVVITKSWEDSSATIHDIARQTGLEETIYEEQEHRTLIKVPLNKSLPEKLLSRYGESQYKTLRKALTFLNLVFSYPLFMFDKNEVIYEAAWEFLRKHRVDYIIATGEPFILFKHAYRLSKRFRVPWIADFRDGWKLNHVTAQRKGIATRLLRSWEFLYEKKYMGTCSFMTTVNPLLAEKLSALHHKKAYVIYNGFEEFSPPTQNPNSTGLPLVLCHAGTLYPGHQAEALLQAIHELDAEGKISPEVLQIQFLGIEFYPGQHQRIMRYSPKAARYLHTTKRLPREEAMRMSIAADFLVVFSERHQPVISGKPFEYISLRRPILVVLNDHSILAALINDLNAGVIVNDVKDLKKFLLEKIEAKRNHQSLFAGSLNEEKASFYLRESQAARLVELMN